MPRGKEGRYTGEETGHNNPSKTTRDTTGSSKRRAKNDGHEGHGGEHEQSGGQGQDAKLQLGEEGLSNPPTRPTRVPWNWKARSAPAAHRTRTSIAKARACTRTIATRPRLCRCAI